MQNADCLFCKIAAGKIPSTKVFENSNVFAFKDLHPSASHHYLFIHKGHTIDVNDMVEREPRQMAEIFSAIREVTQKEGLDQTGFRVVTNMGPHSGQSVFHTHFHVLGGEPLRGFGSR
jgi:histidine triad (HIT) family protein